MYIEGVAVQEPVVLYGTELSAHVQHGIDAMEGLVSPVELVTASSARKADTEKYHAGSWLVQRIVGRFDTDAKAVLTNAHFQVQRKNRRKDDNPDDQEHYLPIWIHHRPGTGIHLYNLIRDMQGNTDNDPVGGQNVSYTPEQQATHLKVLAMPDKTRQKALDRLSVQGQKLQASLMSGRSRRTMQDVEAYIAKYDRLQAALVARSIMEALEIEPLTVEETGSLPYVQLDQHILPDIRKPEGESDKNVEWEPVESSDDIVATDNFSPARIDLIKRLVEASEHRYGVGNVTLYRGKPIVRGREPYYAIEIMTPSGQVLAVAETPILDNATYMVNEENTPGTWQEVLDFNKPESLELGATRIFHAPEDDDYSSHQRRVMNWVKENDI